MDSIPRIRRPCASINNKFLVAGLDHAFTSKWQFMGSYCWFTEEQAQTRQFDSGVCFQEILRESQFPPPRFRASRGS
jgi:hypothetical protein